MAFLNKLLISSLLFSIQTCQGVINPLSMTDPTYSRKGGDLTIPWSYTDDDDDITSIRWSFKNDSFQSFQSLVFQNALDPAVKSPGRPFSNIDVIKPATLVIKNAIVGNSGTYRFVLALKTGVNPTHSDVEIIITEQPTAVVSDCSSIIEKNEGDDITCLCKAEGGNPAPIASWIKDGKVVNGTGNLKKTLSIKNITTDDSGSYTCKVTSHDLSNEIVIKISVKFAPTGLTFSVTDKTDNIVYVTKTITLTCKADGYPELTYTLYHNGTKLTENINGGVYIIDSATFTDAGIYKCEAENSVGKISKSFNLTVSETSSPADSDGLGTGEKVGIAIGAIVFLLIIVGVLVYCYLKKRGEKDRVDHDSTEDRQGNNADPRGTGSGHEENPYESPDKQDVPRYSDPPSSSSAPPLYAQVDKSKKTKKPPPSSSPALTYAALDPVALQPDSAKMKERPNQETDYASIDLGKLKGDLV